MIILRVDEREQLAQLLLTSVVHGRVDSVAVRVNAVFAPTSAPLASARSRHQEDLHQ